ncbi:RHS repeat-associated core domain-containing protein [Pseudomonas sp. IT-P218]|uniref:RHS repeat-associated core domain-containing protein n=1 Tax=Pseudomonas sp. IT-P218 TaxID=3026449 RepID=UPI0039E15226
MSRPREMLMYQYRYDALDRLIGHTLTGTCERQLFYCKSHLATQVQGTISYSLFQNGDQLLAQRRLHGVIDEAALLAVDQQRSVLHAVAATAPKAIAYSAYGHRPDIDELSSLLGFNGERVDPLTGYYLLGNGYRAFNPVLMRFNSPDSFSPFGQGGVNSYAYCLGDPVNNSDQNGHFILPSRVIELGLRWRGNARAKALGVRWLGKARANLSLPVGGSIFRDYFVSPAAIENLGIATKNLNVSTPGTSNRLRSFSTRSVGNSEIAGHNYSSGIHRRRVVYPSRNQRQFDATSGSELDAIFRNQRHPQHEAILGVYQQSGRINIENHLSVPAPHTFNAFGYLDPDRVLERIDNGLTGSVPGVMPSMLIRRIREENIAPLNNAYLRQRYPQFFNGNTRGRG